MSGQQGENRNPGVEMIASIASVTLEVHNCTNRHTYFATFEGYTFRAAEIQAISFIEQRSSTHAFRDTENFIPCAMPALSEILYPQCEHGLSLDLCYGPQHYASDLEISQGW